MNHKDMPELRNPSMLHPNAVKLQHLLLILLTLVIILLLSSLGLLPPDTAGTPATKWRSQSEIDVLLRVETDNERWNVDDLLADAIMNTISVFGLISPTEI